MPVSTQRTVDNICFRIAKLDAIGRQEIFERVERMKTEREVPPQKLDSEDTFCISDLWGVGAELWRDESVNEYIRKERDSWD